MFSSGHLCPFRRQICPFGGNFCLFGGFFCPLNRQNCPVGYFCLFCCGVYFALEELFDEDDFVMSFALFMTFSHN